MFKKLNPDLKAGVLGGGQLGRMMIQEAVNLNIQFQVMDPDGDAPCKSICSKFVQGNLTNYDDVYNFGKELDVLTIEIENVNTDALFKLESEGVKVYPQPHVIKLIQDKRLQKNFYKEHHLPTSEFVLIGTKSELAQHNHMLPAFLKLGKAGYDGRGVVSLQHPEDFSKAFDAPSVLERKIDVDKEISVIVARNIEGDICTFPIVELVFNPFYNMVDYLVAPAQLSKDQETQAIELAKTIIKKLDMVGLLAVEMFVSKQGEILINEIAPRPHNSGHHTIEANFTSQYAQLLRAILGLPLGDTTTRSNAAMVNLLGEEGYNGIARYEGLEQVLQMQGVYPHLYGKKFTKPGRKMGHITLVDQDRDTLLAKVHTVKNTIKVIA